MIVLLQVTYDSNLAIIQADNKATHAALEALKAEVSAARMHESLPHSSLRALMLQRTEAWTAERAALRKQCDELREFKERMQQEVRPFFDSFILKFNRVGGPFTFFHYVPRPLAAFWSKRSNALPLRNCF